VILEDALALVQKDVVGNGFLQRGTGSPQLLGLADACGIDELVRYDLDDLLGDVDIEDVHCGQW
jgi:hypothetical protein